MLTLLASLAMAEVIDLQTPPAEVTVYADRARVTRTGAVQLTRGVHEVAFTGLPTSTDAESLTADVTGGAELLDIQVSVVSAVEAADERVEAIRKQLQVLADKRQDLADDHSAASERLAAVNRARDASAAQLSAQLLVGSGAPAQAQVLRTKLSADDKAAREAVRQASLAMRAVDEQINALQREANNLGSTATDTLTAVVRVDATRAGLVNIDLTYTVEGASWRPRYDLRGDAGTGDVNLALSAVITQVTGEDWSDVKLSVSSARPGQGTDVPTLDPFWLTQYVPPMAYAAKSRSYAEMAPPAAAMDDAYGGGAPAAPPPPMEVAQAVVDTQLAATTFKVAHTEDLPSDGTERKVLLTTVQMDSELRHVCVPRLDLTAYLVGEVTNTADFPLLPGEAGVFIGGAYVGEIALGTIPTGETFDVSFGADDRVSVKRVRLETQTGTTPVVGKRATAAWQWRLDISSAHPQPVTVELREQVPLSPSDDIAVAWKVDAGSPNTEEEDEGILAFTVKVPARSKASATWSYSVTYPGDLTMGWME